MLDKTLAAKVTTAIRTGDENEAGALLTNHYDGNPAFDLKIQSGVMHFSVVRWEVRPARALLELNACLIDGRVGEFHCHLIISRLLAVSDLIARFHRVGREQGTILLNLGDKPEASGLAFCSNDMHVLIPDSDFLGSRGYESERLRFLQPTRWEDRLPVALWRGYPGGYNSGNTWRTLQRTKLCEMCLSPAVSHLFDAGFSDLPTDSQEAAELRAAGLVRNYVPPSDLDKYKYHIDIDGHTNAWSGLFRKLLSGSPVLKISSKENFRQWYYHNLKPYVNYVPVDADMEDLVEKLQWLRSHDAEAREIGRLGAELGYAMSYEAEIPHAILAIEKGFQLFKGGSQVRQASFGCNGNRNSISAPVEDITEVKAQPSSSLVNHVRDSFRRAFAGESQLDARILSIEGMSGRKYRHFINNLVRSLGDARYLEIGTWAGSTLCSAINRNNVRATAIDNWSQFGGPRERLLENLAAFRTPQAYVNLIENDFRAVDFSTVGRFNIYLFDGPHEYQDQRDGLSMVLPALDSTFVFIVDDWNWEQVRRGTLDAIAAAGACLEYGLEIRTTSDGSQPAIREQHSDWHNGYFLSVLSRPN